MNITKAANGFIIVMIALILILLIYIIISIFKGIFNLFQVHQRNKLKKSRSNYTERYGEFAISSTDYMTGTEFEEWCAKFLILIGAENVRLTKGNGDQGVDIIADIYGTKYAIQCKCYSKPLGNKPIQEVYAGMQYYGCLDGAVMTNQYFTSGGKALAQSTGIAMWDRRWIIDKIDLLGQIEPEKKYKPIKAYVYQESGKMKIKRGLWPHQYAPRIDVEYYYAIPNMPHPDFDMNFDVDGMPRFPKEDPHNLNPESIIVIETMPFDRKEEAELFSKYAEKHFSAKTWVETKDRKYITVIQTHVYSVQSNYWQDEKKYRL